MTINSTLPSSNPLAALRLDWLRLAAASLAFVGGGAWLLSARWESRAGLQWALLAASVVVYQLIVLWRNLGQNVRPGENHLLRTLGAGNWLTLGRGVLLAGVTGFLFSPRPEGALAYAPGALYTAAIIADFFDGYLARRTRHDTRLGEILDISLDGVGVLSAAFLAVQYGQVPAWYLLVALARYLFLGGLWLRRRLSLLIYPLPPSIARRGFAGLQFGFLAAMLWPAFSPPGTHLAAALFALPFLTNFTLDWFYASGMLRPAASSPRVAALKAWLPLALRALAAALAAIELAPRLAAPASTGELALSLAQAAVIALLTLGAAGRVAAILALLLLGAAQAPTGLSAAQIGLAAAFTALLYMGSGALSLWRPEDRLIYRRAGEPPANAPPGSQDA